MADWTVSETVVLRNFNQIIQRLKSKDQGDYGF